MEQDEAGRIALVPMTRELCRAFYRGFVRDPDLYMDMRAFEPYVFSKARADAYFDRQAQKGRLFYAVLENGAPVGEVLFKDIDRERGSCTLGIHLINDAAKGRGVGTRAERAALWLAFESLQMNIVYADAVRKNKRSQHVLEKVGFRYIRQEGIFCFYELRRENYFAQSALRIKAE